MLSDNYAVDFACRGKHAIITLQIMTAGKPKRIARRTVEIPKGDGLLEGGTCRLTGGDVDAEIVPIGHYSKKGAAIVTRAYRASVARRSIEAVKAPVECEVEGD